MKVLMAVAVLGCLGLGNLHAADFELSGKNGYCGDNLLRILGAIKKGDAERFSQLVSVVNERIKRFGECYQYADQPSVVLGSSGGDVEEAIAIGNIVRKNNFKTTVHATGCYSSCVLVFAAGVERYRGRGKIGIHRPYLLAVDKKASVGEINAWRQKQTDALKKYALSIDASPQLIDDMNAIPPEEMKLLSDLEMKNYRILGEDPSFEEFRIGRTARLYNVSSSEYRTLHLAAINRCNKGSMDEFSSCRESEMLGIGLKEAKDRLEKFQACKKGRINSIDMDECFRRFVTKVPTK
jgi:hypothetical protein